MNMIVLQSLCANKLDSWRPPAVIWCPTAAFVWWNWPHCRLVHFCRGMDLSACRWVHVGTGMDLPARTAWWLTAIVAGWADVGTEHTPRVCSAAQRSSRPDHWDGLMLDRSAVGQLSSLSSGTKWQRLPITLHTLCSVSPAGNHCRFVLLDKDESCPTADLSNIRLSQWSGLLDQWAVEHAPGQRHGHDENTAWGGGGKNGFITVMPMNVEFVDGVYKLYFVLVVKHVRIQTCKLVLSCECVAFYACNVYF